MCYQIRRQLSALSPGAHAAAGTPVGTVGRVVTSRPSHTTLARCVAVMGHEPRVTSHESRATNSELRASSFELRGCTPASEKRRQRTGKVYC
jgi:hypothetical protein